MKKFAFNVFIFILIVLFFYCYTHNITTLAQLWQTTRPIIENLTAFIITMVLFIIVPELLASFTSKIYETNEDDSLEIKVSKIKRNNQVASHKYKTKNWLLLRDQVFEKYERKCANCGATDNIDVHHKISLKEGGANCIENLIPLCRDCHEKLHGYKFSDDNTKIEFNESYGYKISKDKKSLIGYKICNAIKNKYKLKIKYKSGKFHDGKITERIIRPIEIKLG